jgi:hypothetical protein
MNANRKERIERIRSLPAELEHAVAGLNDSQLDTPYRSGGWTVRQVVHHVADSHMNAFVRMKLILTEDRPTLKPYDQDAWAGLHDSMLPPDASLPIIRGLHSRWVTLLEHVPEEAWTRTAHHPESGEVSLDSLLTTYARHGENHVAQITGLRKGKGWT